MSTSLLGIPEFLSSGYSVGSRRRKNPRISRFPEPLSFGRLYRPTFAGVAGSGREPDRRGFRPHIWRIYGIFGGFAVSLGCLGAQGFLGFLGAQNFGGFGNHRTPGISGVSGVSAFAALPDSWGFWVSEIPLFLGPLICAIPTAQTALLVMGLSANRAAASSTLTGGEFRFG